MATVEGLGRSTTMDGRSTRGGTQDEFRSSGLKNPPRSGANAASSNGQPTSQGLMRSHSMNNTDLNEQFKRSLSFGNENISSNGSASRSSSGSNINNYSHLKEKQSSASNLHKNTHPHGNALNNNESGIHSANMVNNGPSFQNHGNNGGYDMNNFHNSYANPGYVMTPMMGPMGAPPNVFNYNFTPQAGPITASPAMFGTSPMAMGLGRGYGHNVNAGFDVTPSPMISAQYPPGYVPNMNFGLGLGYSPYMSGYSPAMGAFPGPLGGMGMDGFHLPSSSANPAPPTSLSRGNSMVTSKAQRTLSNRQSSMLDSPYLGGMSSPMNNFQPYMGMSSLPSGMNNMPSMNDMGATSHFDPYGGMNPLSMADKSPVEMMLEELRSKMKNHPHSATTTRFSSGFPNGNAMPGSGSRLQMQGSSSSLGLLKQMPPGGVSSRVYEEMGISWSLKDIKDFVMEFAKDQYGSRFIQSKLQDPAVLKEEKDALFDELMPYVSLLCKDVFGNYVIQKLLEVDVGTREQHNFIFTKAIRGHMDELSTHMYGCRVIQKLIEQIFGYTASLSQRKLQSNPDLNLTTIDSNDPDDIYTIVAQDGLLAELNQHVSSLVTDQNGNHVIQKCIEQIRPIYRLDFFFKSFKGEYVRMSKHPYGCRVVQRVLENTNLSVVYEVIVEVMHDLRSMIADQYANYVVQHIIENPPHEEDFVDGIPSLAASQRDVFNKLNMFREQLYIIVAENVLPFSQHKFGSNVVECCIKNGTGREKEILIEKILSENTLIMMMKDPYANYVVQKVIDKASPAQVQLVIEVVRQNEPSLRRLTYGKHIINKLKTHQFA